METSSQFGSYQIIRKIGAGGMADVYEAVRVGLENFQTRVALKCILPAMTRDERFVKMFVNEAHLGSQLQHPNIIQIQDFNKVNETYYIAMEYVEGIDLARLIKRLAVSGFTMPATVVIDLTVQALAGLGYAHEAKRFDGTPMNIIHRDVKPSNFLITPTGVVKVGDFGIAKLANTASSKSLTGDQLKGTINYMSPEQIDGVPLTPASDLFSVGAILYEMLTLRPLFDGPTMSAVLIKIAMVNIETELNLVGNRYPEFARMLRKALARDPKDRFQMASQLIADLRKLREELGDGLTLRDFLAMHPRLFEPYGSFPGEQEEESGPLSMALTPANGIERPDIFLPNLAPELPASFDLEGGDEDLSEISRDFGEPVIEQDSAAVGQLEFEYHPPEGGFDSAFASSPAAPNVSWEEDLVSAAQRLLPGGETEDTRMLLAAPPLSEAALPGELAPAEEATVDGAMEEPDFRVSPTARGRMWPALLLVVAVLVGGLTAAWWPRTEKAVVLSTAAIAPVEAPQPSAPQTPRMPAQLILKSTPVSAQILLDGKKLGAITPATLPLPLDKEQVTVQLELPGYQRFSQEITYQSGQQVPLVVTMVPLPKTGSLKIETVPPGARVFIDQQATGHVTPVTIPDLETGRARRVALRAAGYEPWIADIQLLPGGLTPLNVRLQSEPGRAPAPAPRATESRPPVDPPKPRQETPSSGVATLILNTTPPDAEVYIDGHKRGEVPLNVPIATGEHEVEFRHVDGRKRKATTVKLKAGEQKRLVWDFDEEHWVSH